MRSLLSALFLLLPLSIAAQWSTDPSQNTRVTNGGLLPQIITDGTGGAYIVYQDSPALLRQVWVQWLDKYGFVRFPDNGIRISSADRFQTPYYYLVSDSSGGVIVLFEELHLVGDPFDEETYNAIYAQRMDSTGAKLWGDAGIEISPFVEGQRKTAISACSDGANGAFVFWGEDADGNGAFELWAQRITANGQFAWPNHGIVVTDKFILDNISNPNPAVSAGAGNAIILYSDSSQTDFDTKLQKLNLEVEFLWGEGVDVFPVGRQMIGDGFGGAIVAGARRVLGNQQETIAVQRVNLEGDVLWGESGAVVTELGDVFTSTVALLMSEEWLIIAWQDGRSGKSRVYMQSIDESGEEQWQKDGLSVGSVDTIQGRPVLVKSFDRQFMVMWRDSRIEDRGIFLQKFDSNGSPLWSGDVSLSTRVHFQRNHEATTDGVGGAIACWYEIGTGSGWGVFAQQVSRNGNPGEVLVTSVFLPDEFPLPAQFTLRQSYPNPFNAEMIIKYEIPESNRVTLTIYDITGKEVITLVNKKQSPGAHQVHWNGKNERGGDVASGIYLYQLRAGSLVDTKKALFVR